MEQEHKSSHSAKDPKVASTGIEGCKQNGSGTLLENWKTERKQTTNRNSGKLAYLSGVPVKSTVQLSEKKGKTSLQGRSMCCKTTYAS